MLTTRHRRTDRQTDTHTHTQTDMHAHRHTDTHTDTHRHRHTHTHKRLGLHWAGRAAAGSTCVCEDGWWGPSCSSRCPGINENGGGLVCGGLGECDVEGGTCTCDPCSELDESSGTCVPKTCAEDCENGGVCECDPDTNEAVCLCPGSLTGSSCQDCLCQVSFVA